jgi:hypothetical protein
MKQPLGPANLALSGEATPVLSLSPEKSPSTLLQLSNGAGERQHDLELPKRCRFLVIQQPRSAMTY